MEFTPSVIIPYPDSQDLAIVDIADLIENLDEGQTLIEAVMNAAFDLVEMPRDEGLRARVERLRQLNNTGDSNAYWGYDKTDP